MGRHGQGEQALRESVGCGHLLFVDVMQWCPAHPAATLARERV